MRHNSGLLEHFMDQAKRVSNRLRRMGGSRRPIRRNAVQKAMPRSLFMSEPLAPTAPVPALNGSRNSLPNCTRAIQSAIPAGIASPIAPEQIANPATIKTNNMTTENANQHGADPNAERGKGLATPAGSPTDTPETDSLWQVCRGGAAANIITWADKCRILERERDEARREAENERDRYCHRDHGGHVFPWENSEDSHAT